MVKYKISIKFDKDFLNKLSEETNSGVEIRRSEHHVALHPTQLNSFNESIKDLLSEGIAKYNRNLEGILLGYQNIKLLSNEGYIHDDSCYIHLDLRADFFIFRPEIDKEMQGFVNRKSKDHVGLLVYNAFNVSIPRPRTDHNWLGTSVIVGHKVQFKITYIHLSSCMPFIKGELLSIVSEVDGLDNSAQSMKKSKKHKKQKTDIENTLEVKHKSQKSKVSQGSSEAETKFKHKSKRKKEKKEEEISLDDFNLLELFHISAEDDLLEQKVKKKKLKDKEKEEIDMNQESKIHKKRKRAQSESGSPEKKLKKLSL